MFSYIKILLIFFLLLTSLFASQKKLEKVSIQLNWKYQFEFAGFIAAKEKGFYKDLGLDVDIKEFKEGMNVVDELTNKNSTYIVYDLSLVKLYDLRDKIKLVANYFKRSPLVFVATQDIITPDDLRGKIIMADKVQLEESTLKTLLDKFNIKSDEYVFIQHTFNPNDFIDGNVDVMSIYLSNELYNIRKSKKPYTIIDPASYGIYGSGLNLFTSIDETKNNFERVQKIVQATTKGWKYALNNKDEIIDIIYKNYSKKKTKEALRFEASQIEKLIMPNIYNIGEINQTMLQKNIHNLYEDGLLKDDFNIKKIILDLNLKNDLEVDFTQEQKKYIANKKNIKMCIDPNWMPYEKLEDGKYIGMTSDYIPLISKKIGIPIKLVKTRSWNESIEFAKKRKCDIFSLAMPTPSRLKYMKFTKPYISFPLVLATKVDKLFIADVESLLTKEKIGIVKGYAIGELMKKRHPNNKIVDVPDVKTGMEMVADGKLFGFLGALPTVAYELQHKYIGELKIAGKLNDYSRLGIGVRNDDPILFELFEKAVDKIDEDTKQGILNKYISVTFEKGFDYKLFFQILAVMLIVIAIGIIRHFQLLKYNRALRKKQDELNNTKKRLQNSNKDFQILLDSVVEGIIIFEDDICIEVNNLILNMFEYKDKKEVLNRKFSEFILLEDNKFPENNSYETSGIKKSGVEFPLIIKVNFNTYKNKKVKIVSIVDITDMKYKDKILFQQSKMASMGQMLENIAHQWRQPLSVISTTATSLELKSQLDILEKDDQDKSLALINRTTQYLSQTIDDFRNFFKTDKIKIDFYIVSAIEKNLKLLEGMFKKYNIEVNFEKKDDVKVYNYENEFTQALINIFNNAKDALEKIDGKRIVIINIFVDKEYAIISIKDNGKGIALDTINQVFDPYFTTKHKAQGTGIGLYMTHQIIENNMKGKIEVENDKFLYDGVEYIGAKFTIKLPLKSI
ncbi:MAG: ABC transporter substrate-binding protein [Halarcobacter sp.]